MTVRLIIVLLLGVCLTAIAARTVFLLLARRPVLARVIGSSFSNRTRYSHRRWQLAKIGDALSAGDAPEPTERGTIAVRYTVDGRDYDKQLATTVRKGEQAEPTLMLWYDPHDPGRATDKGISWLGLGLALGLFAAALVGLK